MKLSFSNDVLERIYKKDKLKRLIELFIGLTLSSLSFNLFLHPNNLVSGGVSGLSIIFEDLLNIKPSIFMLTVNIILLILSYLLLGKEKTLHSIVGALLFPIFVELTSGVTKYIHVEQNQLLLATLFAGVVTGTGSGLIYKAGYTSGGTDIINQILSKYFKVSLGNAMYFSDGLIILLSGFIFGINKIMYGLLLLYLISYMTDKVIIGISQSKAFYIITDEPEKIKHYIIEKLHHSVTNFSAKGGFKGEKSTVLMTALPTKEYYKLKNGILQIDKNAFFLVTDAYEVVGGE
ncbi:MAG: YitT family protein [Bacilli bacterium]|nr:YitT family protein [Bacilli bacterium]